MTLKAQIAGVALRAMGSRNTAGLRRSLVGLTNVAVKKGFIERVGADTLLTLVSELELLIMEVKLLQEMMAEGDEPLKEAEINTILDPWYLRFKWDLDRAFAKTISIVRYDRPTNVFPFFAA